MNPEEESLGPLATSLYVAGSRPEVIFVIARHWGLTRSECALMLGVDADVLMEASVQDSLRFTPAMIARVWYVLGIYRCLCASMGSEQSRRWLRRRNEAPMFRRGSPLDTLLSGRVDDLERTYHYVSGYMRGYVSDGMRAMPA